MMIEIIGGNINAMISGIGHRSAAKEINMMIERVDMIEDLTAEMKEERAMIHSMMKTIEGGAEIDKEKTTLSKGPAITVEKRVTLPETALIRSVDRSEEAMIAVAAKILDAEGLKVSSSLSTQGSKMTDLSAIKTTIINRKIMMTVSTRQTSSIRHMLPKIERWIAMFLAISA